MKIIKSFEETGAFRFVVEIIIVLILAIGLSYLVAHAGEKENLYKRSGMLEERMQTIQEKAVLTQSELTQIYQRIGQIESQERVEEQKAKAEKEKSGEKK
jgi:hypothetical protein